MAGHASNWFKTGSGSAKGKMFISNAALSSWGMSKDVAKAAIAGTHEDFTLADVKIAAAWSSPQPSGQAKNALKPDTKNEMAITKGTTLVTQANGKQKEKPASIQGDLAVVETPYGHAVIHKASGKALLYVDGEKQQVYSTYKKKYVTQSAPSESSETTALSAMDALNKSSTSWGRDEVESLSPGAQQAITDWAQNKGIKATDIAFKPKEKSDGDMPAATPKVASPDPVSGSVLSSALDTSTATAKPASPAINAPVQPASNGDMYQHRFSSAVGPSTPISSAKPGDTVDVPYLKSLKNGLGTSGQGKVESINDGVVLVKANGLYHAVSTDTGKPLAVHHKTPEGALKAAQGHLNLLEPTPKAATAPGLPAPVQQQIQVGKTSATFKDITVNADVYGPLAVHPDTNGNKWTVTHVATGYQMVKHYPTKAEAIAAVEAGLKSTVNWDSFTSVGQLQSNYTAKGALNPPNLNPYSYSSNPTSLNPLAVPTGKDVPINSVFEGTGKGFSALASNGRDPRRRILVAVGF